MAFAYKLFDFGDVLTMISGRMVAKVNNTDTIYDFMQFMLNDKWFSEEARSEAPRLVAEHLFETMDEVIEDLKMQFPELIDYEIPDYKDSFHYLVWTKLQEEIHGQLLVTSLDRY
jgi:hypothetical protein